MTALVFVDTNVLLYARDAGQPLKQACAAEWMNHLWRERVGRISTQVLSEYYVNVTRKLQPGLTPADAWADVDALLAWRPQATDAALLRLAREIERDHRLSWWDSLIVAAARAQGCATLLTEDLHDGAVLAGVTVRNPFVSRLEEQRAGYNPAPASAPRHRGRGRPRRAVLPEV